MSDCVNPVVKPPAGDKAARHRPSSFNHRPSMPHRPSTKPPYSNQLLAAGAPSSTSSSNVAFSSSSASVTVASQSAPPRVSNCSNVESPLANPVQGANIVPGGGDERVGGSDDEGKDDIEKPWWRQCDAHTLRCRGGESTRSPWCARREQRIDDSSGDICQRQPSRQNGGNNMNDFSFTISSLLHIRLIKSVMRRRYFAQNQLL
jgi:hypothetical protein